MQSDWKLKPNVKHSAAYFKPRAAFYFAAFQPVGWTQHKSAHN